jgi:hypothetical protein
VGEARVSLKQRIRELRREGLPALAREIPGLDHIRFGEAAPAGTGIGLTATREQAEQMIVRHVKRLQRRAVKRGDAVPHIQLWATAFSHSAYLVARKRAIAAGYPPWEMMPRELRPFAIWALEASDSFSAKFLPERGRTYSSAPGVRLPAVIAKFAVEGFDADLAFTKGIALLLGRMRPPQWSDGVLFAPPILERRFDHRPGERTTVMSALVDWALPRAGGIPHRGEITPMPLSGEVSGRWS